MEFKHEEQIILADFDIGQMSGSLALTPTTCLPIDF
jgi:hypothetical protein